MHKYTKIGALLAMLTVAIGAFGAHILKEKLSADMLEIFQTGVQYQMFHSLGILLVALLIDRLPGRKLANWAANLHLIGIVIFSGSLYTLAITEIKWLGAITPIGGIAFIAGWVCLLLSTSGKKTS